MREPDQATMRNAVLRSLTQPAFDTLASKLRPVDLPRGQVICEAFAVVDQIVFPESGIVSIVATTPEGLAAETGLFGRDGFGPTSPVLEAPHAAHRLLVQVEGHGWRISRRRLMEAAAADAALRSALLHYVHVLTAQTGFTSLSSAVHTVNERLARWILMCDDRLDGRLTLTHDFLALMLGVRRPTVTTALHVLEGNGFIRSERNSLIVRDRAALQEFAGDAYGQAEAVAAQYFPGCAPADA